MLYMNVFRSIKLISLQLTTYFDLSMYNRRFNPGYPLIVRDLPLGIDANYLASYLGQVAPILECRIEGTIGFIKAESENAANLIIARLNYSKFNNIPIQIIKYDDENRRISADGIGIVIVRGLPPNIEIIDVNKFFSRVGEVLNVQIPRTDWGSLGFAFVQYKNPSNAYKAATELTGFKVGDNILSVEVIKKNGAIMKISQPSNIQIQQPTRKQITARIGDSHKATNYRGYNNSAAAQQPINVSVPKKQLNSMAHINIVRSAETRGRYEITI